MGRRARLELEECLLVFGGKVGRNETAEIPARKWEHNIATYRGGGGVV
jgi:hypothetical protein